MRGMSRRTRAIVGLISLLLLLNLVGAAISIAARWPAETGGIADPDRVASDFVTRGTLLAAPLLTLVLLAAGALLVIQGGRLVAASGLVGLILIAVIMTIGTLGSPLQPEASDPPVAFLVVWRGLSLVLLGLLAVLGSYELRDRLMPRSERFGRR